MLITQCTLKINPSDRVSQKLDKSVISYVLFYNMHNVHILDIGICHQLCNTTRKKPIMINEKLSK